MTCHDEGMAAIEVIVHAIGHNALCRRSAADTRLLRIWPAAFGGRSPALSAASMASSEWAAIEII